MAQELSGDSSAAKLLEGSWTDTMSAWRRETATEAGDNRER